ncbi:MAG: O-antigen ligase family protein [bacterium]
MRGVALIAVMVTAFLLFTPYYYFAPVPALVLIATVWIFRNPAIGFYLIVLLIPFAAFRKIGPVNIPWVIMLVVITVFAINIVKEKRLPSVSRSNLWPLVGLYIIVSILSTLFAEYPDTAKTHLFYLLAGYGFVLVGMLCLTPDSFRTHIPNMVIWGVGLSTTLAFLDYVFGWSLFRELHLSGNNMRSIGGALDPNNFSIMILFTLPFAIHRAFYPGSQGARILLFLLVPLMLLTVTSTFSRSGFLTMIFSVVLLIHHYRRYLRPRILGFFFLLGFCGFVLTIYTIPENFWERQLSLLKWEDKSLNRRYSYLFVGGAAVAQNPLFGSGPGAFKQIYENSETSRKFSRGHKDRARSAHNTYLEVVVGTGILGFLLFMALNIRAVQNFRVAERMFLDRGEVELANLAASQRIGYLTLMLFLLTLSEQYHKFMLLSLVLSQGAIYFALRQTENQRDELSNIPTVADTV